MNKFLKHLRDCGPVYLIVIVFLAGMWKIWHDESVRRSRVYQLSCSGGFESEFGDDRPYKHSDSESWYTPSGNYVQKPGEACRTIYRQKTQ
jgi:hypothetical protein